MDTVMDIDIDTRWMSRWPSLAQPREGITRYLSKTHTWTRRLFTLCRLVVLVSRLKHASERFGELDPDR
jgi:hypothetical protein